jgi:hypothetical protein
VRVEVNLVVWLSQINRTTRPRLTTIPSSRCFCMSRFGGNATRSSVFGSLLITCVPGEGSGIGLCRARRVGWREISDSPVD